MGSVVVLVSFRRSFGRSWSGERGVEIVLGWKSEATVIVRGVGGEGRMGLVGGRCSICDFLESWRVKGDRLWCGTRGLGWLLICSL